MTKIAYLTLGLATLVTACAFDSYAPPDTVLEGRLMYQGQPIGVRQNAIQLELWQDGYDLRTDIPVYVHQDGTFAATLFEGTYKLVRKQNNGPWRNDPDTMVIELRGQQSVDVPVEPFFIIRSDNMQRSGSTLTATFDVEQVVQGSELERVALYVGNTSFVDARYNAARAERDTSSGPITLTLDLSSVSQNRAYVFARIGVKTKGVEEMLYTQVQKIQLQ